MRLTGLTVIVSGLLLSCCRSTPPAPPVVGGENSWYWADGRILPDALAGEVGGEPRSPAREWLVVYNPHLRTAKIELRFYFESEKPRTRDWSVGPLQSKSLPLHEISEDVPPGLLYGTRLTSDIPVVPQSTRGEYAPGDPVVTQAMASRIGYPGPLGPKEALWAYADGLLLDNATPLVEREWVTILNPGKTEAQVVVYLTNSGRTEKIRLSLGGERVATVPLWDRPEMARNALTGVTVQTQVPVVVEQIRRAWRRGSPQVLALWSCFAHPIGGILPAANSVAIQPPSGSPTR